MMSGCFSRLLRNVALSHRCGVVLTLLILHQNTLASAQTEYEYINAACQSLKQVVQRCSNASSDAEIVKHLLYAGAANCMRNDDSAMVVATCMPGFLLRPVEEALNPMFGVGLDPLSDSLKLRFPFLSCDDNSSMWAPEPQSQTVGASPFIAPSVTRLSLWRQPLTQAVVASAAKLLGELLPAGELVNLSHLAFVDASLDWLDVLPPLRHKLTDSKGGGPAVLPLDGATLLLVYRKDVLDDMEEQVPRTWDELAAFVESYSASRPYWAPDAAMCATTGPSCDGTVLFEAVWHSIAQSKGVKQGVYFSSQTLQPAVTSPAFHAAYRLWERLWRRATPQPAGRCSFTHPGLRNGDCVMVVGTFEQVKEVALTSRTGALNVSATPSDVGRTRVPSFRVTQLPGSTFILDPETGSSLINCTMDTCSLSGTPAQEQRRRSLPASWIINQAPFVPSSMLMGGISTKFSDSEQLLAWHALSYIASPVVSLKLVTAPGSNLGPFRGSHFSASAAWAEQGYDAALIQEGLDELLSALQHSNLAWELNMPDGAHYTSAISTLLGRLLPSSSATPPSSEELAAEVSQLQSDLVTYYSRPHALEAYRDFIKASSVASPQSSPAAVVGATARVVGIVVAAAVVGLALLGIAAHMAYRSNCGRTRRRLQKQWTSSVPAVSPSTTLLITDIEGSTKLWEELPEAVMGRALHIHNSCLRHVLVRYQGYESATEGDSFILAFHRPGSALAFAVEAQQELLEQDWPAELLVKEVCAPVYTYAPSGFPLKRSATFEAVLSRMSLRQPPSTQAASAVLPACLSRSFLVPRLPPGPVPAAENPQEVPADIAFMALHSRHNRLSAGSSDKTSTAVPAALTMEATAISAVAPFPADTVLVTTSPPPASPDCRISCPSECPSACSTLVSVIGEQPCNEGQPQLLTPSASSGQFALADEVSLPTPLPAPVLKPGGLSRELHILREQQHERPQSPQPQLPHRSPHVQQHMHLQYDVGRSMLGSLLTSSSGWAIIHGRVACTALHDKEMSGAATLTAAGVDTSPACVGEYLSAPSAVVPAADGADPDAVDLGSMQVGGAMGRPLDATEATELAGSSEPLALLCSSTRPSPRRNRSRHTQGGGGCTPTGGTPPGVTPAGSGHGPRSTMKPPLEGPYSSGGMSFWEACTLEESLKAASKQYEEGNNVDRKRRLLWCGLRVRMGLHSGITSASELTLNRASMRTVYSGECASVIRAVADSAQGGTVVLTEACLKALAVQQAAAGATHAAASEALLLHIGRYCIRHRDMTLSLYLATCPNLAPRAAMLPPPRNITPVGLTTYAAPVGRAAVAVLNVPDLTALREWDSAVIDDAMSLMAGVLLDNLAEHRGYLVFQDWQHGTVMAAFAFPLDAVRWALHCRQQLSTTTDWPAALLAHELCREGFLTSYPLHGSEPLSTAFRNTLATGSTRPSFAGSGPLPSPTSGRHTRRGSLYLSHALSTAYDHAHLWSAALSGGFGGAAVPVDEGKAAIGGGIHDEQRDTCMSSLHFSRVNQASRISADLDALVLPRPQEATCSGGGQRPGGSSPVRRVPGPPVGRESSCCSGRWGNRQGLQVARSQGSLVVVDAPPPPRLIHPARSLPAPEMSTAVRPGLGATPTTGRASSYVSNKMAALSARIRSSGINTAGGYLESTITTPRPVSSTISGASELQPDSTGEVVAAARGSSSPTQGRGHSEAAAFGRVQEMSSSQTSPVPPLVPPTKGAAVWLNSDDAETEDGGDMFAMHLGDMEGCAPAPKVSGPSASSQGLLSLPVTGPRDAEGRIRVRLRGPRIRIGIDCGDVEWNVSTSRRCLTYNGLPVTAALKLASAATSGHVLATTAVMVQVYNMQMASLTRSEGQEEGATARGTEAKPATGTEGGDGFHTTGSPRGLAVVSTPVHPASTRGGFVVGRNRRQQLFSCRFTPNWEDAIHEHEAFLAQANGSWHTTAGLPSGGGGWNSPRTSRLSGFPNAWNWSTNSRLRGKRGPVDIPASTVDETRRSNTARHSFDLFRSGAAIIQRLGKGSSFQNQPTSGAASSAPYTVVGELLPTYLSHAVSHPAPSPARAILNDDLAGGRITPSQASSSRLMSSSATLQTSHTRAPGAAHVMPVSSRGGRFSTISHPLPTVSASAPSNVLPHPPRALVVATNHTGAAATSTARAPVIEPPYPLYPIANLHADSSCLHSRPGSTTPEDSFSLSLRYHASKATVTSSMFKSGSNAQGHASRPCIVGSLPEEQPLPACQPIVLPLEGQSTAQCSAPARCFSSGLLGSLTLVPPARAPPSLAADNMGNPAVGYSQPTVTPLPAAAVGPTVSAVSNAGDAVAVPDGSGHRGSVSGMLQQALRQHRSHTKRLEQQAREQQRREQQANHQQHHCQHAAAGGLQVDVRPSAKSSPRDSKNNLVSGLTASLRQSGSAAVTVMPALPLISGERPVDMGGPALDKRINHLQGTNEDHVARADSTGVSGQEIHQDAVRGGVRAMEACWPAAISLAAHRGYGNGHSFTSYKAGTHLATVVEDSGTRMLSRGLAAMGDGPRMLEGETVRLAEKNPWSATAAGLHAQIAEKDERCKDDCLSQVLSEGSGSHSYVRRRASTSPHDLTGRRELPVRSSPSVSPPGGASTDEFGGQFEYRCRRQDRNQRGDGEGVDGSAARVQTPHSPGEQTAIRDRRPLTSISGLAAVAASPPSGADRLQVASSTRSSASRDLSLTWSPRTGIAQGSPMPDGTFFGSAGEATSLDNSAVSDDLDDSRATVRPPAGWRPGVHPPQLLAPLQRVSSLPHGQRSSARGVAMVVRALRGVGSSTGCSDGAMGLGIGGGSGSGRVLARGGEGRQGSSLCTLSLGGPQNICHNLDEPDMWLDESYAEGAGEQKARVQY